LLLACWAAAHAAEPLPVSKSFWQDESFVKSFNGSYRIEARIEPVVSGEERALLVEVQKLMAAGNRADALAKIRDSKLTSGSAALQFNLGNLRFEEGEMKEAAEAYQAAIETYPAFRRAHRNLGLVRVREGELEEGLGSLLEALRLGDADGTTYGMLGYCRLQRGEHASALQAYRMAALSQPESTEWKAGIAQCLQHLNARDEAVALLDEVIRQRPEEAAYAVLQASILIELERPEQAVKALELPRRLGVLDPDGRLLLAELHLRAGRVESAAGLVDEAFPAEGGPSVGRILGLAELALGRKEWDLAEALIARATPAEGEVPTALRRLRARFGIESGKAPDEGAATLRELLAADPVDGESLLALANHEMDRKNTGVAEILFERATAVEETAAEAWIGLTRLHVDAARYARALDAVDRVLELRPTDELRDYREGLARLAEAAR
jgi:tetratricopeptide (TPR) repeat protein